MQGTRPRWHWLLLGGGALLTASWLVAALCWGALFDAVLRSQIKLVPGSRTYTNWLNPSVNMTQDIYMFNWTNADKFPEEKPHVQQVGPYRYRERRHQVNVSYHAHNASLGYRTFKSWTFEPEGSASLDDNITILNVIAASAVYRSRFWNFFRQKGLSMGLAMFGQELSVTRRVRELLYEGYEDPLLDLARSLPASATGGAPPVDRFGLFYGLNNSIDMDGYMEVTSGEGGELPGQILKWNGLDHLPYYEGECAKLQGSVGGFFPHNLTEESTLTMFMPDLCRSVRLRHQASGQRSGVPFHQYAFVQDTFDNSTTSADNTCFCNGACAWAGVMNVSACRYGSPAFLSLPHYLHADPALRRMVAGLAPRADRHSFYFAIEPRLGVPIEVTGRFQFNVFMEPSENVVLYENVPRMLFPIFWVEQRYAMSSAHLAELRMVRAVCEWGPAVCAGAALLSAAVLAGALCALRRRADSAAREPAARDGAEVKLNPNNQ